MITKDQIIDMAGRAGFGANQRNTLLVKLEFFAKYVWEAAQAAARKEDCEDTEVAE